jgi:chromosomal replication initiator protein
MAKVDPALWRDMLAYLRQRHAPLCREWFRELEPVDLEGGLLRVQTSSAVQQNYLQRKCLEPFTEAAQTVTSALIAVRFVTEQEVSTAPAPASHNGHGSGNAGSATLGTPGNGSALASAASNTAMLAAEPVTPSEPRPALSSSMFDEDHIVLSPDYSFDQFITGPGNELAYAASVAVANQPGSAYNPLFIHGGVGLGKTHLLQAICQTLMQRDPNCKIVYMSCDTFMNQFLDCVQRGQMAEFRHRYRHADVLMIDDIHFLANRERTQEEFFHTFNALYQANKQIVLSSDSPPAEIPQLEERLVSRFQWGLVATVTKPCYETRVAIIRAKLRLRGLEMPDEVVAYIARKIDSNARELEGAITTVQGHAALKNKIIDIDLARQALGESNPAGNQVTLQSIIHAVTEFYNVKLSDLQSKRRHKSITEPRQVCMWLARKRTRLSLEEIGGHFGGRDHTTVMHAIRTIDERREGDASFSQQVTLLDERVGGGNRPVREEPAA